MSTLFATHPAILHIFTVHRHLNGFVNGKYKVKVRVVNIKGKYDIPNLSNLSKLSNENEIWVKGVRSKYTPHSCHRTLLNPPLVPSAAVFRILHEVSLEQCIPRLNATESTLFANINFFGH